MNRFHRNGCDGLYEENLAVALGEMANYGEAVQGPKTEIHDENIQEMNAEKSVEIFRNFVDFQVKKLESSYLLHQQGVCLAILIEEVAMRFQCGFCFVRVDFRLEIIVDQPTFCFQVCGQSTEVEYQEVCVEDGQKYGGPQAHGETAAVSERIASGEQTEEQQENQNHQVSPDFGVSVIYIYIHVPQYDPDIFYGIPYSDANVRFQGEMQEANHGVGVSANCREPEEEKGQSRSRLVTLHGML